jgi:hypothetical protein
MLAGGSIIGFSKVLQMANYTIWSNIKGLESKMCEQSDDKLAKLQRTLAGAVRG